MKEAAHTPTQRRACAGFRRHDRGATLVEFLVAVLVVGIGLMGAAKLAAYSLGHNKIAQIRLTGTALAADYADRARLNLYGFDLGGYSIALDDAVDEAALVHANLDPDTADDQQAASALAAFDRNDFMRTVAAQLPQGQVVVNTSPADGRSMDLWLIWQQPQASSEQEQALLNAGGRNCPSQLEEDMVNKVSCLYLKVQL